MGPLQEGCEIKGEEQKDLREHGQLSRTAYNSTVVASVRRREKRDIEFANKETR